jgi:hypothetical protein
VEAALRKAGAAEARFYLTLGLACEAEQTSRRLVESLVGAQRSLYFRRPSAQPLVSICAQKLVIFKVFQTMPPISTCAAYVVCRVDSYLLDLN